MKNNISGIQFPFVAVVGQEQIKRALVLNLVNPCIGGVLISGDKGTAKSTLIRSIKNLREDVELVELPLNTSEDRLIGTIDIDIAIKEGKKSIEYGILKKADNNILYVDEVNLLSDHIVKTLMEVSSSKVNNIEREGITEKHDSRFILIGSMNPEEGNLRPKFLDSFGLYVEVEGETDSRKRIEIIKRRLEFENNPVAFCSAYQEEHEALKNNISWAISNVSRVEVSNSAIELAVKMSRDANCEGHRGEITIIETAKAMAALEGRIAININDIKESARLCLLHRSRKSSDNNEENANNDTNKSNDKQNDTDDSNSKSNDTLDGTSDDSNSDDNNLDNNNNNQQDEQDNNKSSSEKMEKPDEAEDDNQESDLDLDIEENEDDKPLKDEKVFDVGEVFSVSKWLSEKHNRKTISGSGKRSIVKSSSNRGRYTRYRLPINNNIKDIAFDATLRNAAINQFSRSTGVKGKILIAKSDIRVKVREKRTGNTIIFVVDASGSMGAKDRMIAVKGAIMSLLTDAYQKRDKVGLITFNDKEANIRLGVTRSVDLAHKKLKEMPTFGRTPLSSGLDLAYEMVKAEISKDKDCLPVIVLVSDGRATYSPMGDDPFSDAVISAKRIANEKIKTVVIDCDMNFIKLGLGNKIGEELNAEVFKIEELKADNLLSIVKTSLDSK